MTVDLRDLFLHLQGQLAAHLQSNRAVLRHPGAKGSATEERWRQMFEDYLPWRYCVSKGFVIDADGQSSDEIDLIIHDRQYSPFLFNQDGAVYIPAESVYAVFEIKQDLRSNVGYAAKKVASVRRLLRTQGEITHILGKTRPDRPPFEILGGLLLSRKRMDSTTRKIFRRSSQGNQPRRAFGSRSRLDPTWGGGHIQPEGESEPRSQRSRRRADLFLPASAGETAEARNLSRYGSPPVRESSGGMTLAHLLIVTLGPIQDFIAAARRTRDLWFGSWLLSELSKATAQAMAEECGLGSLVFPGVSKPEELWPESATSVANKIVVRVPNGKNPAAVAARGQEGLRKRLEWLRDQAFAKIETTHFKREPAEAQVRDLIEFAWVSAPELGDGYAQARHKAESLMGARKNTRLWAQVSWGAEVPKSSIDGERESVIHEDLFDLVGKKDGLSPEDVRKRYGVGPTERLCGVGLLKRHGTRARSRYSHRFLSTGHLAAWPLYYRTKELDDQALKEAWLKYLEVLEKGGVPLEEQEIVQGVGWKQHPVFGPYDGSLLFENRLPELFEEVVDSEERKARVRTAKIALAEFLKKLGVQTPLPYYAILVADGDHMGKAIERQKTFEKHQDLSQALDQFAQSVRSVVEGGHGGELVYSGGDDVLALVPLHRAVACARELAKNFQEKLSQFPADEEGQTPTLSAGIGVSHFLEPLRRALHLAREAEGLAKETRNSLAIIVDKRSGPPVRVSGVWGTLDKRLEDYVWLHREDKIPDGAAYELEELARLLEGAEEEEKENLEKLVRKEAERILCRKQPRHGEEKGIDTKVLKRLSKDLDDSTLSKVVNRLIVARLFAQASEQADEKLTRRRQEIPYECLARRAARSTDCTGWQARGCWPLRYGGFSLPIHAGWRCEDTNGQPERRLLSSIKRPRRAEGESDRPGSSPGRAGYELR